MRIPCKTCILMSWSNQPLKSLCPYLSFIANRCNMLSPVLVVSNINAKIFNFVVIIELGSFEYVVEFNIFFVFFVVENLIMSYLDG